VEWAQTAELPALLSKADVLLDELDQVNPGLDLLDGVVGSQGRWHGPSIRPTAGHQSEANLADFTSRSG